VQKGALLASLDSSELRAVVASSRVQATLDKQRLERAEDLHKKGFFSKQALDEARSNYARSAAKVSEDQARLAKTEIRAAFSGVAGLRQVSEGAYVAAGTDIARIDKIDQLKLDFRIPEGFSSQFEAEPEAAGAGGFLSAGELRRRHLRHRAGHRRADAHRGGARAGRQQRPEAASGHVRARAAAARRARERGVDPEEAIVPRGQDSFVFRVVEGKAEMVKVQTGTRKVGEVEILKGIAAGDMVITEGTQRIAPGGAVNLIQQEKPAAEVPAKKG